MDQGLGWRQSGAFASPASSSRHVSAPDCCFPCRTGAPALAPVPSFAQVARGCRRSRSRHRRATASSSIATVSNAAAPASAHALYRLPRSAQGGCRLASRDEAAPRQSVHRRRAIQVTRPRGWRNAAGSSSATPLGKPNGGRRQATRSHLQALSGTQVGCVRGSARLAHPQAGRSAAPPGWTALTLGSRTPSDAASAHPDPARRPVRVAPAQRDQLPLAHSGGGRSQMQDALHPTEGVVRHRAAAPAPPSS